MGNSPSSSTPPPSPTITGIDSYLETIENPYISISFTQPTFDGIITTYYYSIDGIKFIELNPAQTSSPLNIPIIDLSSGITYTFSIKAETQIFIGKTLYYILSDASNSVSSYVYFPQPPSPTITSITAYNQSAIINFVQNPAHETITNYAYSYSLNGGSSFKNFTLLDPASISSPLTVTGLTNGTVVSFKIRSFNGAPSSDSNIVYNKYVYNSEPIICFKDDTKILTNNGYVIIRDLKEGDLVETFKHGLKPITVIGKTEIIHEVTQDRTPDKLYKYCKTDNNELTEDLILTGRHAILVDEFITTEQKHSVLKMYGIIKKTDDKYHLPAAVDNKSIVHDIPGQYTVYHLALQNDYKNMNYGIYANGLLVESCSEGYLKSQTSMIQ